ncbi:Uncharacterised protein [Legionella pneumophila]|nr:hypothetical protein LpnH3D14_02819 [Legionella pneumophila]CZI65064.1 Uncharacterised protein [Legionella pneumophila]CZI87178.1 Uncharacterised protein [Legionella pneumophila]CZJ28892.1 Uncharacterised protein [Legionella pneumophila]SNW01122.1 Uncharacterised protein [Legionella pneumophila]
MITVQVPFSYGKRNCLNFLILELSDCPPDYGAELGRYGPGMGYFMDIRCKTVLYKQLQEFNMINMKLKATLIACLSVLTLSSYANSSENKEAILQQCHDLASTVASLVSSQAKKTCAEKLVIASIHIDTAADWIVEDVHSAAKQELDNAIYSLQYAELNSCNRYIQISHSKLEAQRIKSLL